MSAKLIAITQKAINSSALLGVQDAIDRAADTGWAIFGLIGAMLDRDPDPVGRGALQVALEHASKLNEIQAALEKIRASEA